MKVTSVELHPAGSSEVALLSFRDPGSLNPYNVKTIVGLDADEIVARYYAGSGSSTKLYNLGLLKRELTIRISLNPRFALGESYSSLRDAIYKLIASSRTGIVQIQFKNDSEVVAAVSGFVTKMEATLFAKEPEVQLTIKCNEPMFKALTRVDLDAGPMDPTFTVIEDSISTAPHGFIFELSVATGPVIASLTFGDPDDDTWSFVVAPSGGFANGDHLFFSSELNNKYLYLVRGGSTIYLADAIAPGSVWPILFPGVNNFEVSHPANVDWVAISHYPTYWGV